jgi:hypothetical protein
MPLCPLVRPTAIHKDFCWLYLRFHQRRPIALGPGLQFEISLVPQFAALWATGANLCGTFAFDCTLFFLSWSLIHRFASRKLDLTFYWRIYCDDVGRVQQSARLVPNILDSSMSK